jgi:spore coat polysaccharide biosynthesis protein SpsF
MNYTTIIQARVGSTRRPGKVIELINDEELLSFQINRLKYNGIEPLIVATTTNSEDDIIERICEQNYIGCFRGSATNLIERYLGAIEKFKIDFIIRVGGDDPLIDPVCIRELIEEHKKNPADFIYASHKFGWIYGTAAELIDASAIRQAFKDKTSDLEKEHIIPYIKNRDQFKKVQYYPLDSTISRQDIFLSVDYQEDLDIVISILQYFNAKNKLYSFSQNDLIQFLDCGSIRMKNTHLHSGFELV